MIFEAQIKCNWKSFVIYLNFSNTPRGFTILVLVTPETDFVTFPFILFIMKEINSEFVIYTI